MKLVPTAIQIQDNIINIHSISIHFHAGIHRRCGVLLHEFHRSCALSCMNSAETPCTKLHAVLYLVLYLFCTRRGSLIPTRLIRANCWQTRQCVRVMLSLVTQSQVSATARDDLLDCKSASPIHIHCAGIGVLVLKITASARVFRWYIAVLNACLYTYLYTLASSVGERC